MLTEEEALCRDPEERMKIVRGLMKEIWRDVVAQTKDWVDKEVPEMPVYFHSEDRELEGEAYFTDGKCDNIKLKALYDVYGSSANMKEEYTALYENGEKFHRLTPEGQSISSDFSIFCYMGLLRIEAISLKAEKLVFDEDKARGLKPVYIATFDDIPLEEAKKQVDSGISRCR